MAPIRVGIIGISPTTQGFAAGSWGAISHLPALRASAKYEVVALANSTVESAQKSIAYHGLPPTTTAHGSPEDLAKDPTVDLIIVSVNVQKHYALARTVLENKKDCFVEWPLGASLSEAKELTRLATASRVKTMVGLQARAGPVLKKVKSLISEGKIGEVVTSTAWGCASFLAVDAWMTGAEYYLDLSSGGNEFTINFGHCRLGFISPYELSWNKGLTGIFI